MFAGLIKKAGITLINVLQKLSLLMIHMYSELTFKVQKYCIMVGWFDVCKPKVITSFPFYQIQRQKQRCEKNFSMYNFSKNGGSGRPLEKCIAESLTKILRFITTKQTKTFSAHLSHTKWIRYAYWTSLYRCINVCS